MYNLKDTNIKRKIELNKIQSITLNNETEFVIHVTNENDLRYCS